MKRTLLPRSPICRPKALALFAGLCLWLMMALFWWLFFGMMR
jgi:hypothetical protein